MRELFSEEHRVVTYRTLLVTILFPLMWVLLNSVISTKDGALAKAQTDVISLQASVGALQVTVAALTNDVNTLKNNDNKRIAVDEEINKRLYGIEKALVAHDKNSMKYFDRN